LFSNDCRKLRLKKPSKYSGLFIAQQITSKKDKYGYKMGTARLKKQNQDSKELEAQIDRMVGKSRV